MNLAKLIAEWIVHHCDETVEEVAYVLDKAYPGEKEMYDEYVGVIEYLSRLDNPEYKSAMNYLFNRIETITKNGE